MRNDFIGNFIEHSAKGKTWANHRYVAKAKLPSGKYLYFYDMATYQNYLKKTGQKPDNPLNLEDKTATRIPAKSYSEAKTTEEKKTVTQSYISSGSAKAKETSSKTGSKKLSEATSEADKGKQKTEEILNKVKSSNSSKKTGSSNKTSSKNKKGSSKSSKNKKSTAEKEAEKQAKAEAKAQKQAESNAKKEAKAREKAEKQAKKEAEKEAKALAKAQKEAAKKSSSTTDRVTSMTKSFKTMLGIKDKDISSYQAADGEKITSEEAKELESSMISKYKTGATGYLISDSRTFRWTKTDNGLELEDVDTNEKVSLESALIGSTKFSEFKLRQAKQTEEKSDTKLEDTDEYEWMSDGNGKYVKVKKK